MQVGQFVWYQQPSHCCGCINEWGKYRRQEGVPVGMANHFGDDGGGFCPVFWDIVHRKLLVLRAGKKQFAVPFDAFAKLDVM